MSDDNRLSNLRLASRKQNCENVKMLSSNTSGFRGVTWHKGAGKWSAQIQHNRENRYLGLFEAAALAAEFAQLARDMLFTHHNEERSR